MSIGDLKPDTPKEWAAIVPSWVHVSKVRHPKVNRGQVLVYLASNKKYIPYGEWQKGMI